MLSELRQKAVVQTGGVVAIQSLELPAGKTVEVIILVESVPYETTPTLTNPHAVHWGGHR
jgi:hypothetical protein